MSKTSASVIPKYFKESLQYLYLINTLWTKFRLNYSMEERLHKQGDGGENVTNTQDFWST